MKTIETTAAYLQTTESDWYVYSGPISVRESADSPADRFVEMIVDKPVRLPTASLFLTTYGGSPESAFRIATTLRRFYERFRLFLAGPCKSAGTLIALGAHELAFSPTGELGPLDIQMAKPDELAQSGSGLDIFHALAMVTDHGFEKFEEYLARLIADCGGSVSTKTASEICVKLVNGIIHPIAGQIDPMRLGEAQRAMAVAKAYGERLGLSNCTRSTLETLVTDYPSHGFVIDQAEAAKLFKEVRSFTEEEQQLARQLKQAVRYPHQRGYIQDIGADIHAKVADNAGSASRGVTSDPQAPVRGTPSNAGDSTGPSGDHPSGSGVDTSTAVGPGTTITKESIVTE